MNLKFSLVHRVLDIFPLILDFALRLLHLRPKFRMKLLHKPRDQLGRSFGSFAAVVFRVTNSFGGSPLCALNKSVVPWLVRVLYHLVMSIDPVVHFWLAPNYSVIAPCIVFLCVAFTDSLGGALFVAPNQLVLLCVVCGF